MVIRRTGNPNAPQVLELSDDTIIHGDVVFEREQGRVLLRNGAKILGEVIGGVIQSQ